ncbi:MAG: hypothetical protein WBO82_07285 [Neisseria sp.]
MNVALKYDGLATRDMIREAAEAEQNYQKTGKHITLKELNEWAAAIQKNPDTEMPECHN